jgi:hypothetical protein
MPVKSGAAVDDILTRGGNVLLAIFADIHANRQVFSACPDAAHLHGAERMIFLGDYRIRRRSVTFNAAAQAAIEWTHGRLGAEQHRFRRQSGGLVCDLRYREPGINLAPGAL